MTNGGKHSCTRADSFGRSVSPLRTRQLRGDGSQLSRMRSTSFAKADEPAATEAITQTSASEMRDNVSIVFVFTQLER